MDQETVNDMLRLIGYKEWSNMQLGKQLEAAQKEIAGLKEKLKESVTSDAA